MSNSGEIRIIVAAGLDRSVEASFGTVEKMAERCVRNVNKAFGTGAGASTNNGPGAALGRGFRSAATEADKAARQAEAAWNKELASLNKVARAQDRVWEKQARDRARLTEQTERDQDKALRQETRNVERESDKQSKIAERAARKVEAEQQRFASRTSHRAVRFLFPNPTGALGMASRIGGDIARGAGVDFSIAGSMSRAVEVESLSQQLSNQGYRKGEAGPAGQRVAGSTLESEARKVGKDLSLDPHALLESQMKFLDVTGDLDASRKNMKGLAEIAAATNTDFTAMAEAAGNVSRHLEEGPEKAEKLMAIMRVIAGQGKVGSIEIKDFAAQMAKIAALAPKFSGDVGENITKLTTLAQLSRAEGGSATAAQAATATARFVDIFSTSAREKKFEALGIKTYKDAGHTRLVDPFEIIRESLVKTKGDALKMADLFKSVMSQRAVSALTNAFNNAGGGAAGITAVNSQFAEFGKEAAIKPEEVSEANKLRQETLESQAKKFQDVLDEIVASAKTELTPALKSLAPSAAHATESLAGIVTWAAKNPGYAVATGIGLAIARAGAESGFRTGIEGLLKTVSARASGAPLQGIGGGLGVLGNVGAVLSIASIAVATIEVGKMLISEYFDNEAKEQNAEGTATGDDGAAIANAKNAIRDYGHLTDDQKSALEKTLGRDTSKLDRETANGGPEALQRLLDSGDTSVTQKDVDDSRAHIEELKTELQLIKQLLGRNLNVTVTNAEDFARDTPKVYAPGRQMTPGNLPAYLLR